MNGNQGTTRGKEKISMGIDPTTSVCICVHMYPYFLFAAIHHLYRPRLSLSDLVAQSAEYLRSNPEVVGSIATEVKRFFLYLVWFPDSLY